MKVFREPAIDLIKLVVAILHILCIQWLEQKKTQDTEIAIRSISVVFTQEELQDRWRRNLGTFPTRKAAEAHERAVQYFKRHG